MSTLKVNTLEEATTGGATYFTAKAWVNFNGSGTVEIRKDGNVLGITDNGTGNYTVNFSNILSSDDYCCNFSANDNGTTSGQTSGYAYGSWARGTTSCVYATGSMRVAMGYAANASFYDQSHVNVSVVL